MANVKINDLQLGTVLSTMQLETDIAGTTSNKITVSDLTTYIVGNVPPSGGLVWNTVTSDTAMSVNNGYIANSGLLVTFTLPMTASVGSTFIITSINSNWQVAQNTGQTIKLGNIQTTTGVSGYCASTLPSDYVEIVCVVANTTFIIKAPQGTIQLI